MRKSILKYFDLIRILTSILIGIIVTICIIFIVSDEPEISIHSLFLGPIFSKSRFGSFIETASVILFCGIAVAIPFTAGQFNLGAEGALFIGATAGTAVAISTKMPPYLHIPLVLMAAGAAGALWGLLPGILKAKWNVNELVTSLMLNYVAYYIGLYVINYHFRDKAAGFLVSYKLPETTWLSQFVPGTRIHTGIFISLIFAIIAYLGLFHTRLGYEIRTCGSNIEFARYGGLNIFKVIVITSVIGGFVAGIGGMSEVMGIYRRFNWNTQPGYGWDGVVVAIIGRNNPLLIILASLFLAYLRVGGGMLNLLSDIPTEMVSVIQAIIILLITAEAFLSEWKNKIIVKEAKSKEKKDECLD